MKFTPLILSLALLVIAGCSTTQLAEPAASSAATPTQRPMPTVLPPTAQSTMRTATQNLLDDPQSALVKRTVYFDFDSFVIRADARPIIESHSKYLASSRSAKVRVEGSTDERGGREYNLALGQRRAEMVLKSLQLLGAPAGEMEAISYGKEKPADPGHDEAAWAKNRRADLNYLVR